jgi:RimJ/RimL family protein N-acetyltransferase
MHVMEQIQSRGGEEPLINMVGEKVALGPIHKDILPILNKWENDFEVTFLLGDPMWPVVLEETATRFARDSKGEQRDQIQFIMYEKATLRPIGLAKLRNIDSRNRTATYGILIGEKDCWSKGYGTETTRLMLDYGFTVLGLHNIDLTTSGYNERAIRAYERAGFRLIGQRREAQRWGDKVYPAVIMDCLASEFETPLKRLLQLP